MLELQDIVEAFNESDPSDRLELLIDFGRQLKPLEDAYARLRDEGLYLVHECQAPVFLKVEQSEDRLRVVADVPAEAPIARGFTGLLVALFDGGSTQLLETAPADMLKALGVSELLGMQRTRGLSAIYSRLFSSG